MAIVFCIIAWLVLASVVVLSFQERRERILPLTIGAVLTASFAVVEMWAAAMPALPPAMQLTRASTSIALGAASALFARLVIQQIRGASSPWRAGRATPAAGRPDRD